MFSDDENFNAELLHFTIPTDFYMSKDLQYQLCNIFANITKDWPGVTDEEVFETAPLLNNWSEQQDIQELMIYLNQIDVHHKWETIYKAKEAAEKEAEEAEKARKAALRAAVSQVQTVQGTGRAAMDARRKATQGNIRNSADLNSLRV
ncbi:unnamed protein product [Zymoseptoria tritici ST99CH_1A5]|uniref:Uncharacterized protein n=1 Tax=Zymoseptoria tritici ST99CH_1A5 TaxID=1276529 RepID=A0A1Y6M170_ZYMTR|nr:unnamed protein product [Zymoseptoria tritici ST99CH_1A5]